MRQSAHVSRLLFVGCLILAAYFAFSFIGGWIQGQRLEAEAAEARHEVAVLRDKKERLQAVKRYVSSDAYIEQEARRRLGFVRPGEVPFVIESPSPENAGDATGEWWQRLFSR
jgi:cell division protein FtsB/cell division protein DivIC